MIIVGGENLIDLIQTDRKSGAPLYQANPGGGPYNCAKAIGRQGSTVGYLTPISEDSLGQILAAGLDEAGAVLLNARRKEPTSLAVVSLSDGIPNYQFYREKTAERMVTLDGLAEITPSSATALYVGSLALTNGQDADIWADYYCQSKSLGMFTALDPNIRAAFIDDREAFTTRLEKVLAHTDLLKLSDEDLEWLYPDVSLRHAVEALMQITSAKLLVVTLGSKGALGFSARHNVVVEPSLVREMHDTVGAGDTFMATLLSRLDKLNAFASVKLDQMDHDAISNLLKWATCAAALNCEKDGCNPPYLDELELRFHE